VSVLHLDAGGRVGAGAGPPSRSPASHRHWARCRHSSPVSAIGLTRGNQLQCAWPPEIACHPKPTARTSLWGHGPAITERNAPPGPWLRKVPRNGRAWCGRGRSPTSTIGTSVHLAFEMAELVGGIEVFGQGLLPGLLTSLRLAIRGSQVPREGDPRRGSPLLRRPQPSTLFCRRFSSLLNDRFEPRASSFRAALCLLASSR